MRRHARRGASSLAAGRVLAAVLLALSVFEAQSIHALDPDRHVSQYMLRTWGEEDGLPQLGVTAVTQARSGALWVGTQEGLARFDGAEFMVVDRRRVPALGHNFVLAVAPCAAGGVWVGTQGGLVAVDEQGRVRLPPDGRAGGARVTFLHEDRRGRLWVGTQSGALERLDDHGWTRVDVGQRGAWRTAFEDEDGGVWVGGDDGLVVVREARVVDVASVRQLRVAALARGTDGVMWVGTDRGLAQLAVDGDVADARLVDVGVVGRSVVALAIDAQQNVWVAATGTGIGRLRAGAIEWLGRDMRFATDDIRTLFLDADGALWLGSTGGGLARLTDPPVIPFGAREGLPRDIVFPVVERAQGEFVVGTQGGGLGLIGPRGVEVWTTSDGLASNFITALHVGRDGGLWVGTLADGLDLVEGSRITHFGAAEGLPVGRVFSVLETRAGEVLVATESGLFSRPPGSARFDASAVVGEVLVMALAADMGGRVWVGTQRGLLRLGPPGLDGARPLERRFDEATGLGDAFVTTLAVDDATEGGVWVGTASGLARVVGDQARSLANEASFALGMVLSIVEDGRGHLWVGTNRGLVRFGLDTLVSAIAEGRSPTGVARFGRSDGLRSAEFNGGFQPTGIRARDGRLWFSTVAGLVALDPLRLEQAPGPPVPQVDVVRGDGQVDDSADGGTATFGAGTKVFEFRYGVVAPSRADTLTFRYRLEGFDRQWVEAGARRSSAYTNLAAGTYRFHVEVCVTDGRCRAASAPRVFTLEPYLLERPSVLAALALALASLAWSLHRLRLRAVRRRTVELAERAANLERAEREAQQARGHAERALVEAVEARARAEVSERAKSEFLANMSHEIRTPLNAVLGMLDMALGTPLDANLREMLGVARGGAEGLLRILNDVLDLSKCEAGAIVLAPIRFAFRERVERPLGVLRHQAQAKGLTLDVAVDDDVDAEFVGDPDRLGQVLINLVANAIKFTASGGVTVEVRSASERRPDGTRSLSFAVRDTGIGIPAARLAAIFEPFEQADSSTTRRFGGTGLGLTIARKLVERMGGQIDVESEPGLGTTFRFTVALGCVEPEERSPVPAAASLPPSGRASAPPQVLDVLLAEDNLVNQQVARRILASLGHRLVVASNGVEVVEAVGHQSFDVVLMDVHMPELDGIEATRRIRAAERGLARRVPIVAITAGALEDERKACFDAGMDVFLTKPLRPAALAEVLARIALARRASEAVETTTSVGGLGDPPRSPR
jgi:signal transduction histidine kinase/ligand-binding sensor domain-containing protein/CheY-like chemotaxis protein